MEQFKHYLEETYLGESCYIDPEGRGWASYKIMGEECYIAHCYLAPAHRGMTLMSEICSHIEDSARASGCKFMSGSVDINSRNPERSLKMMLADGYKLGSTQGTVIYLMKKL